jgi:hypothetical protein
MFIYGECCYWLDLNEQRQQEDQDRGATLSASAMHSKLQRLIYDNVISLGVSNELEAVLNKSIVKVPSVQQAKQQAGETNI